MVIINKTIVFKILIETYRSCDFQGGRVLTPLPLLHVRDRHKSSYIILTYMYAVLNLKFHTSFKNFTLCEELVPIRHF